MNNRKNVGNADSDFLNFINPVCGYKFLVSYPKYLLLTNSSGLKIGK